MPEAQHPAKAFLLMPFDPTLDWLRDEIVLAGESAGVSVERADDIFEAGVIIEQVKKRIEAADAVVAVCTGRNANVFYELGIADHWHEPILIAEAKIDLPFDVRHYRALFYGNETTDQDGKTFRERLAAAFRETIEGRTIPTVLGQEMSHVMVSGLHRRKSLDRISVDVVELTREIKKLEDEGKPARKDRVPQEETALGLPAHQVQEAAERMELITFDWDRPDGDWDWYLTLTEKGRAFTAAYERWNEAMLRGEWKNPRERR